MRGTTPTEFVHIPDSIVATDIAQIWFTIAQDKRVIIDKTIEDGYLEDQTFAFPLSQEETLRLDEESECNAQVRILMQNGKAWKSQIWSFYPGELVKDGIITL